ncbi:ATP-binding cassette domain-containing protein [Cryomorphaceae bacterium 1068]|nr:ATP-binding cassette domain-containing protein [Cryomorphaceae bacterium 1068]
MSERILNALVQLFAIIARVHTTNEEDLSGRTIVESFLKERLPGPLVRKYLDSFEIYLEKYQKVSSAKNGQQKRTSVNSVKVLRICTEINEELTQRQKTIVLIRLLEFIYTHSEVSDLEQEFVNTVAITFNFDMEEFKLARLFVEEKETELIASQNVMYITDNTDSAAAFGKHLTAKGLDGYFRILRLPTVNLHFIKYKGKGRYNVSGQPIINDRFYVLNQGASIRGSKISPIYYSDILGSFLKDNDSVNIQFRAKAVSYTFKKGNIGLHDINIEENSGSLVGIMGASGSGKSTLLNVLNGNLSPKKGTVSINGIDIHHDAHSIEGVIGYIAQDDLLIEELTVFQNLFYNTKLCFGQKSDEEISDLVHDMLSTLGLTETADLKVGNPLDKTISGGQRKRLNIALELIREPAVLFIDEPTSGLSSRDSENIMDLLKELCLKGKLIFVVIHQPSSDIFKMFDSLLVLDKGGYPIYSGNPVDSLVYFRKMVNHVNSEEAECLSCGNVKTEDVFNIIEAKIVDEFGNLTPERKISPLEWYELYKEHIEIFDNSAEEVLELPESNFTIPGKLKQLSIFIKRDVLSKLTNRQYVLINLLEAPVLAMILAFFMRFFVPSGGTSEYVFRENENIPVYIFISVIVALFIGLTVSSEEIIRDKKIRKRESFLNLSKGSYLSGKIGIMLAISAIQMLLFVLIGNTILEIKGMTLPYWAILFSTCTFANVLGLNISASFNSAKVIYILIPIVIIPQLLFSGIIVKFDRLNPIFASQSGVPWIGNIMASRWAYEAIAVTQFKWNDYEENFYELERRKKFSNWKKDYWITELKNKTARVSRILDDESATVELESELIVLRNELQKENAFLKGIRFNDVHQLTSEAISTEHLSDLRDHLDLLEEHYRKVYNQAESEKENAIYAMTRESGGENSEYEVLFDNFKNDQLEVFATNRNDLNYIAEHNGELIQKKDLIYLMPYNSDFFSAHFYAPAKKFFGNFIDTFFANLMVIWGMTIGLIICLFFDVFPRLMRFIEDNVSLPVKK